MKSTRSFPDKNLFPMSSGASEWASERMSAVERASETSSTGQAKEWAVLANERAEERMAQNSTRVDFTVILPNVLCRHLSRLTTFSWRRSFSLRRFCKSENMTSSDTIYIENFSSLIMNNANANILRMRWERGETKRERWPGVQYYFGNRK